MISYGCAFKTAYSQYFFLSKTFTDVYKRQDRLCSNSPNKIFHNLRIFRIIKLQYFSWPEQKTSIIGT